MSEQPLPTTSDGYIDIDATSAGAGTATDTLTQRIWDIDDQLTNDIDSIDGDSDISEFSTTSTRDIQREWDENMEQGRQLLAFVIVPFVGRWLGKKVSYWIWTRFLQHHYKFRSIGM